MADCFTLISHHADEGMSVKDAAKVAGKSERTIRDWCEKYSIGRAERRLYRLLYRRAWSARS